MTHADEAATQTAIADLETAAIAAGGLHGPAVITPSNDGAVARVTFVMPGSQNDPANHATVERLRGEVIPSVFADVPEVDAYVSGAAASVLDSTKIFSDGLPMVFAFVLGLSFLLLLVAFRSIVIPTTAILLNLLSMAAAYGVLTLVFQDGWLAGSIGVTPGPVIEAFVPLFVFTIVYGLSMDYHLFILTRIKEARDQGLDSREAVARGISVTAGTITSAAAIMVIVFAVFVTMKFASIQQLGLGLAVAVFIDATIIRTILLPATMRLLGDWNWYLPKALGWLPHVTIEVESHDGPADSAPVGQPAGTASRSAARRRSGPAPGPDRIGNSHNPKPGGALRARPALRFPVEPRPATRRGRPCRRSRDRPDGVRPARAHPRCIASATAQRRSSQMTNAISMVGLTKHYKGVQALTDLTLDVPAGTIFGFLGPNGAGKTTALKVLAGLARPTAGRRDPQRRRRVGRRRPPPRARLPRAGPAVLRLDDRPRDPPLRRPLPRHRRRH